MHSKAAACLYAHAPHSAAGAPASSKLRQHNQVSMSSIKLGASHHCGSACGSAAQGSPKQTRSEMSSQQHAVCRAVRQSRITGRSKLKSELESRAAHGAGSRTERSTHTLWEHTLRPERGWGCYLRAYRRALAPHAACMRASTYPLPLTSAPASVPSPPSLPRARRPRRVRRQRRPSAPRAARARRRARPAAACAARGAARGASCPRRSRAGCPRAGS